MRIVFFMRNVGYIRNFEWVMRNLAAKGHQIRILFDNRKMLRSEQAADAYLDTLCQENPNITFDHLVPPNPPESILVVAARRVRLAQDYLRYLEPAFDAADKPRERVGRLLSRTSRFFLDRLGRTPSMRNALRRFFSALDSLIPPRGYVFDFLRKERPDLLMVTPLFGRSHQADYFKAAKRLGIRSCLPVASWDNLTSKGVAHAEPNRVLVWNEPQRREAIDLQNIPAERVTVTGAHTYDHWFTWTPSTSRDAFMSAVGLRGDRPYVIYLGSSLFIAPDEPPVVLKWAKALRDSGDPLLQEIGILIRPHPQNAAAWADIDVSFLGNAAVHPRLGSNPVSRNAKSEFFDSMHHSTLVVGVNTSGLIEAGILGKPVHTVLFDEMTETQEGTLHFHHLAAAENGLLHVSADLDEHVARLAAALREDPIDATRSKKFVEWFVRPLDLKSLPTEVCAGAIEKLGGEPCPAPQPLTAKTVALRIVAAPLLLPFVPWLLFSLARRVARMIPGEPYRVLRPIYIPLFAIVFRRKKS
jgi:hypothetical protein